MHKNKFSNKFFSATVSVALALSVLAPSFLVYSPAVAAGETCSSITLASGDSSMTAGYTETNPLVSSVATNPAMYSEGVLVAAKNTNPVIPPWIDPAVDPAYMGTGAMWISSSTTWPNADGNTEGSKANDQWRLFHDSFTLPAGARVDAAQVWFSADNAANVYANGNPMEIGSTNGSSSEDVYGIAPNPGDTNYSKVYTGSFMPVKGDNTLDFVLRNWAYDGGDNPTGLLYKAVVNYCVPDSVKVTISKYIDGEDATAETASSSTFAMHAAWNAENIGAGEGDYGLSPEGFNSPDPYTAVTADMSAGADYSTYEKMDSVVGASCDDGVPFTLAGYTVGDTEDEADNGTPTMDVPSFTDLSGDKYVVVWNSSCQSMATSTGTTTGTIDGTVSSNGKLAVTGIDAVKTDGQADNTYADGWVYNFHVTVPKNEPNVAMKFSNWIGANPAHSIAVANNMRISSAQASSSATVTLTGANNYSSPDLVMVTDLDPSTAGIQTIIKVEVKLPIGTADDNYSTNYGVRSLP